MSKGINFDEIKNQIDVSYFQNKSGYDLNDKVCISYDSLAATKDKQQKCFNDTSCKGFLLYYGPHVCLKDITIQKYLKEYGITLDDFKKNSLPLYLNYYVKRN